MVETEDFRSAMARLGAAVNVITSDGPAGRCGMTASAVCSVTDRPPMLLVCINRASSCAALLKANGVLCVNVLAPHHRHLSDRFARHGMSPIERFAGSAWSAMATGAPVLDDASAAIDCRVASVIAAGTHDVFFCEVEALRLAERAEGLIYFNRTYHPLIAAAAA